ncbi:hypothetical protein PCANC_24366 [Puccinia coronata f. sp. avenae]|uniref:Uncharacterized protein n=1 Tax=Puccinia coronata f. sp. avenae TaxID=200324 RepID=A0A2N5TVB1_9BASI|nr:hypothetical protein PCANC_24366 [Puccinia coronata f. sp. avenae]
MKSVLKAKELYQLVLGKEPTKDGGNNNPQKLWTNILEFGASKKEANVFKAWYLLMHLPL